MLFGFFFNYFYFLRLSLDTHESFLLKLLSKKSGKNNVRQGKHSVTAVSAFVLSEEHCLMLTKVTLLFGSAGYLWGLPISYQALMQALQCIPCMASIELTQRDAISLHKSSIRRLSMWLAVV